MGELEKIHDIALNFELDIQRDVEIISELRVKMHDKGDAGILNSIIPLLSQLVNHAQNYKDWLQQ